MSEVAIELRRLAERIEEVCRESRVHSMAWEYVRALSDYLTLRALVIDLQNGREYVARGRRTKRRQNVHDRA